MYSHWLKVDPSSLGRGVIPSIPPSIILMYLLDLFIITTCYCLCLYDLFVYAMKHLILKDVRLEDPLRTTTRSSGNERN